MTFTVNKNPSRGELRTFGYVMLVGFAFVAALLWLSPWIKTRDVAGLGWSGSPLQLAASGLAALGAIVCGLAIRAPSLARPVYVAWMTVGVLVGTVVSIILLTVLFVGLLPVFSIVVRLGDPLRKRLDRVRGGTYWEDVRPHDATLDRMQRAF